ncbi:GA module-containing protein [Mycoplasma simbae]|uniref:GA module-containing protein n=1 Tax=Mycoplasma simbae TaxID=36744 RepID=UPI000495275B|nr:GA module-containing protein [Mycoplasma simbae]
MRKRRNVLSLLSVVASVATTTAIMLYASSCANVNKNQNINFDSTHSSQYVPNLDELERVINENAVNLTKANKYHELEKIYNHSNSLKQDHLAKLFKNYYNKYQQGVLNKLSKLDNKNNDNLLGALNQYKSIAKTEVDTFSHLNQNEQTNIKNEIDQATDIAKIKAILKKHKKELKISNALHSLAGLELISNEHKHEVENSVNNPQDIYDALSSIEQIVNFNSNKRVIKNEIDSVDLITDNEKQNFIDELIESKNQNSVDKLVEKFTQLVVERKKAINHIKNSILLPEEMVNEYIKSLKKAQLNEIKPELDQEEISRERTLKSIQSLIDLSQEQKTHFSERLIANKTKNIANNILESAADLNTALTQYKNNISSFDYDNSIGKRKYLSRLDNENNLNKLKSLMEGIKENYRINHEYPKSSIINEHKELVLDDTIRQQLLEHLQNNYDLYASPQEYSNWFSSAREELNNVNNLEGLNQQRKNEIINQIKHSLSRTDIDFVRYQLVVERKKIEEIAKINRSNKYSQEEKTRFIETINQASTIPGISIATLQNNELNSEYHKKLLLKEEINKLKFVSLSQIADVESNINTSTLEQASQIKNDFVSLNAKKEKHFNDLNLSQNYFDIFAINKVKEQFIYSTDESYLNTIVQSYRDLVNKKKNAVNELVQSNLFANETMTPWINKIKTFSTNEEFNKWKTNLDEFIQEKHNFVNIIEALTNLTQEQKQEFKAKVQQVSFLEDLASIKIESKIEDVVQSIEAKLLTVSSESNKELVAKFISIIRSIPSLSEVIKVGLKIENWINIQLEIKKVLPIVQSLTNVSDIVKERYINLLSQGLSVEDVNILADKIKKLDSYKAQSLKTIADLKGLSGPDINIFHVKTKNTFDIDEQQRLNQYFERLSESKLLAQNEIMSNDSLNESQKQEIIKSIQQTSNINDVYRIVDTNF